MNSAQLEEALEPLGVPVIPGYPGTGATVPYVVIRPMTVDPATVSVAGAVIDWDSRWAAYACAGSVDACYNLGLAVCAVLDGKVVGGEVTVPSLGYVGAEVEGHYETQVTIQTNQGGLS